VRFLFILYCCHEVFYSRYRFYDTILIISKNSFIFSNPLHRDLAFILSLGGEVDWVALSFVQTPQDMVEFRQLAGSGVKLMAKLEKPSAIDFLEEVSCSCSCSVCVACFVGLLVFLG